MRARPAALALHGVILAGLVAGPLVYVAADHTVTLSVDGATREVRTYAGTVGALLAQEGLSVGPHDVVAPSERRRLHDGMHVELLHGRPVDLVVDGTTRRIWTTAATVDELVGDLDARFVDAYFSVSRSTRIPLDGLAIDARLPKAVTLTVAGVRRELVTTAATWGDVLAAQGVSTGPLDIVSVPLGSPVVDGGTATVTRVATRLVVQDVRQPVAVRQVSDPSAYVGTSHVVAAGSPRVVRVTWRFTMHDGRSVQRTLVSKRVVAAGTPRVVASGTRARPRPHPVVHRTSVDGLNWSALARCESGGNPRAVGGGGAYFGLYQFSLSTWHAVGGSGSPVDASSTEQTYRAKLLYLRSGADVWPTCGQRLFT